MKRPVGRVWASIHHYCIFNLPIGGSGGPPGDWEVRGDETREESTEALLSARDRGDRATVCGGGGGRASLGLVLIWGEGNPSGFQP